MVCVVRVGRPPNIWRNNCTSIFLCKSASRPNFLVLKAEKFALFWRQKWDQRLYLSAFRLYRPAILTYPTHYALRTTTNSLLYQ